MFHLPTPMLMATATGPSSGQQLFTTSGTFVVPAGVTSICAVAIGTGGWYVDDGPFSRSGGGGALSYVNGIAVTPGELLPISITPTLAGQGYSTLLKGGVEILKVEAGGASFAYVIVGDSRAGMGGSSAVYGEGSNTMEGGGAGGYTSAGQPANGKRPRLGGGGSSPLGGGAGALAGASANLNGQNYGGGAALGGNPGLGCVRIIWGEGRAFPNTNTGDL